MGSGRSKHAAEKTGGGKLKKVIIFGLIFIVLVVALTYFWYNSSLSGTGTKDESVSFEIGMGSGPNKIASILKENDVIKSEFAFKLYTKLNNVSNFQAGKYTLTKDMTVPEIVKSLQTGKVFKDTNFNLTFIEGKTFKNIADNTEQDVYDLVKDEDYLDSLIEEYWFITNKIKDENIYYSLEGYLFPDTYTFEDKNVSIKDIFKIMLDQTQKVLDEYRNDIEKSKYTVHEILAMASIIENEAVHDKDRKGVASVLYNRLNSNMSLGSDVTTYYAAKVELGSRDLYRDELNSSNPYNARGPNMAGKLPVRTYLCGAVRLQ